MTKPVETPETAVNLNEYTLIKPIQFDGETVTKLTLDFDDLSAEDLIVCVKQARRIDPEEVSLARATSLSYQMAVAARAAKQPIELIRALKAKDFTQVTQLAANFLMMPE